MLTEVYCVGNSHGGLATCAMIILAYDQNGKQTSFETTKKLGNYTKMQADVIAVLMALRCIKPERRDQPIIVYPPPGYAFQALERSSDNKHWLSQSQVNAVHETRAFIGLFPHLTITRLIKINSTFLKCVEMAKICRDK